MGIFSVAKVAKVADVPAPVKESKHMRLKTLKSFGSRKATQVSQPVPTPGPNYDRDLANTWGGPMPAHFCDCMADWPAQFAVPRGEKRVALITGGTGGIGFYVAKLLAQLGHQVILPQRPGFEKEAAQAMITILNDVSGARIEIPDKKLDLASFQSVREFAAEIRDTYPQIDVLCLHAGRGGAKGDERETTMDGNEAIMQVNALSHAILTDELMPLLKASPLARIVVQTSGARLDPFKATMNKVADLNGTDESKFSAFDQYRLSKASGCLFVRALNEKLLEAGTTNIRACVCDPGLSATGVNAQHNLAHSMCFLPKGCIGIKTVHAGAQHAADGALPMVLACATPDPVRNGWYAPGHGIAGHGLPVLTDPAKTSQAQIDPLCEKSAWPKDAPEIFWRQMVQMTGTTWNL